MAFDPEYANYAPGTEALLSTLELAAGEGVERAEFLGAATPYKRSLADHFEPIYEGIGLAASLRGSAAARALTDGIRLRRRLKRSPRRSGSTVTCRACCDGQTLLCCTTRACHPDRGSRSSCSACRRRRPGRLVGRHARAAGDPRAVRRRDRDPRLGPDVVQPRARARRAAGGLRRPAPADARLRGSASSCSPAPRSPAHSRRRSSVLVAARARPGCRRRGGRLRRARPAGRRRAARTRRPRGSGRSPAISARRSAPPPAGSSPSCSAGSRSSSSRRRSFSVALVALVGVRATPMLGAVERPHVARERRAAARLGRARGRALPARDPADQRLAARAARRRARRHGDAARGDRGGPLRGTDHAAVGPSRVRRDPRSRAGSPRSAGCRTPAPRGRSRRSSRSAAGLGLALSALTERALAGRSAQAVHGGWTIAARHAGVVLGLLLLTPIFTADLERNEDDALAAGTAAVLDSRIPPLDKLGSRATSSSRSTRRSAEARVPDGRRGGRRRGRPGVRRARSPRCRISSTGR